MTHDSVMNHTSRTRKNNPEAAISSAFDLQDCHDGPVSDFFYCDVDGQLHAVALGKQTPMNTEEECPFHYASAALIANGQVVGHVTYTDH